MPWFKVDDTFAMHEKVMAAGNSAIGLWTRAGAWSMQQLTDGFVPNHVLRALGTPKERRSLVEVSLWVEAEGGIRFKDWEERQPSRDQLVSARQAAAERQRHARERAKSQRESRRDKGVSHGPPIPSHPIPTTLRVVGGPGEVSAQSTDGAETTAAADASAKPKPKTGTRLDPSWTPDPEWHRDNGFTDTFAADQLEVFRDYWTAKTGKDATKLDWSATWRNWLRRANTAKPPPRRQSGGGFLSDLLEATPKEIQ